MLTYKFFIKKGVLILRLRNNGVKTEINTHEIMSEEELDRALVQSRDRKGNGRHKKIIVNYTAIMNDIREEILDKGMPNCDVRKIRAMFEVRTGLSSGGIKGEFMEWFDRFMESKVNRGTKGVYKQTLTRLTDYCGSECYTGKDLNDLRFSDIDYAWLEDFEAFCAKTASKNARNIHLRNIRAVFNYALDHDVDAPYPFRRFKIRPEQTQKRAIGVEELREIFTYPVEPYAEIYRDMFKLIFLLIGINTADLHALEKIENKRINYRRAKTHRLYSIKVEPEALEIIKKYKGKKGLLCIADRWSDHRNFRHQINKALQSIGAVKNKGGRMKGGAPKKTEEKPKGLWPNLTTYVARHTWATIAYNECGISKDIIAQALGHGDNTVTDIYLDKNRKLIDAANRRVIDYVLYGKGETIDLRD